MPPKTVVCSICSQSVLKSQTLARGDGSRACRSHPGIETEAEALRADDKNRREKETSVVRKKPAYQTPYHTSSLPSSEELRTWKEHVDTHCWVCDQSGVGLREFYFEAMIAMKRLEIRGEFNFLSLPHDVAKMTGNLLALISIPYVEETDRRMLSHIKDRKIRDILHFLRYMLLCGDCVRKHGFQERFEALMPKPTMEQIEAFMPVMAAIEPVLKEEAERKEKQS